MMSPYVYRREEEAIWLMLTSRVSQELLPICNSGKDSLSPRGRKRKKSEMGEERAEPKARHRVILS